MEANITNEDLKTLAMGPDQAVEKLTGYVVNGFRFHTEARDRSKKFQNCGVWLTSSVTGYASARDINPNEGEVDYYGVLQEIVRVRYDARYIVMFKCKWYDVLNRNQGFKIENGLLLLNSARLRITNEPYILASQARQCFYMNDPKDDQWHAAITTNPRDYYNMGDDEDIAIISCPTTTVRIEEELHVEADRQYGFTRDDVPPEIVDE